MPQVREIRARLKGTAPGPPPTRAEVRMVALHEQDVKKYVLTRISLLAQLT